MARSLARSGAVGAALAALLGCVGLGGENTFASERGQLTATDAAALDALLSAAGRTPEALAVLSAEDWSRSPEPAIVLADTRVTHLRLRASALTTMSALAPLDALREVDLTGNAIARIEGVGPALEVLTLRNNALVGLSGLDACSALRWLYVDDNQITSLAGLAALPALQDLSLNGNQLTTIEGIAGRDSLTGLYVERNRLTSLDGVHDLPRLSTIAAGNNAITRTDGLSNVPKLHNRSLVGNPVDALAPAPTTPAPEASGDRVAALPDTGGALTTSRSGIRTRGSSGSSEEGTITQLSGVAFLELSSHAFGASAPRAFTLELTTTDVPVQVYSASGDGGFRVDHVAAGQTAHIEGLLAEGGGVRTYGVWIEAVGGAASGIRYHGRTPGR